jgi:predicted enzyme related to lactoylglutathione lyase
MAPACRSPGEGLLPNHSPRYWLRLVCGSRQVGSLRQTRAMGPLLLYVDAVTVPVPDLGTGMAFYCGVLGHELIWRNDTIGSAGLSTPGSATEIVLTTQLQYEPDWKVASADAAADLFRTRGGRVVVEPEDIPIGRVAVVEDPFGNRLVVLDSSRGTYDTDESGAVTGVS